MNITKNTRWKCFAGAWICSLFYSATGFFSIFCSPLMERYGCTRSEFAWAYSIYMFLYCVAGYFGGSIAEKLSPRIAIYIGAIMFGVGWILTGFAGSLTQLYIFYGVLGGIGGGIVYPSCLPTALKWFPDKAGSISGLTQAGAAVGPLVFSPVAQAMMDAMGAQMTCRILGVIFIVGMCAVAWMVVPCPQGWLPEGYTPVSTGPVVYISRNYTAGEMLKTPLFWILALMFVLANASGTMMVSFTSPIAQSQIGTSAMTAALCVSIMTFSNLAGRISFGFIFDKVGAWTGLLIVFIMTAVGMLGLIQAGTLTFFVVCVVVIGFSFGGLLVVFAPVVKQIYGSKYYNSNYGLIFIGYGIGAFVGPKIAGYFADTYGVYTYGYIGGAICALAAAALTFFLIKPMSKKQLEADAAK